MGEGTAALIVFCVGVALAIVYRVVDRCCMEKDLALGSCVWIEHKETGDVYYKVRLILEKQPATVEFCKVCHRGQLSLMGHLIQTGILDDKVYAVTHCEHCCAVTVFIYHVEAHLRQLPEAADCEHQPEDSSGF